MWLIDPDEVSLNVIVLYRVLLLKESDRDIEVQIYVRSPELNWILSLPDVIIIMYTLYDS